MSRSPNQYHKLKEKGKRGLAHLVFGRTMVIAVALLLQLGLLFSLFFSFARYIPYTLGGMFALTAGMLVYVLNSQSNPSVKLSWCIVIALMPVFGSLLYVYIQCDLGHRLEQRLLQFTINESLCHAPDQSALRERLKAENKSLYNLATYTQNNGGYSVYENTAVTYFPSGEAKFQAMLEQIERAEKFIFLEYFSIDEGYMWDTILELLQRKVAQGVEVRVMYDGTCAVALLPYNYPRHLKTLGIQCKEFSPIRPLVSTHYNNRDHRKILIIDGHTAFTGGVNLADRYINEEVVYGHWKDTAVMLQGDAARSFTFMFLQMWNFTEKERIYAPYLDVPRPKLPNTSGYVIPYGDSPLDTENVGEMVYLDILNQAKDYVYITTPYLILDNEMLTALQFAARRGVDVRLILPHIPDKKYAFVLAKSHYKALTEAGVKIYEYTPGFIHAKVFLSDDIHAVVGTINLDYRSLYLNFECAAYLYNVPALKDIYADIQDTLSKSQPITMEDIKRQPLTARVAGALLKVAAPLM